MDIRSLYKQVEGLEMKVHDLDKKLKERDATITMLMTRLDELTVERTQARLAKISSGPSVRAADATKA